MGTISTHHNKPIAPAVRLTTSQSILLDVVRITAAMIVFMIPQVLWLSSKGRPADAGEV